MKKVNHCALNWTGLDVHAWVDYRSEILKKDISLKDWEDLPKSKKDILFQMCVEAIEYSEDSIIEHINNCIAEYVQDNYNVIIKDLIKNKITNLNK